jgi:hypothetical protein
MAMPPSKKVTANQHNAQRSTGPRTARGKAHSRLNALKHGLAIPASSLPALEQDVTQLARAIAGEAVDDVLVLEAATRVAEAAIDVLRARMARAALHDERARRPEVQPAPHTPIQPPFFSDEVLRQFSQAKSTREQAAFIRTFRDTQLPSPDARARTHNTSPTQQVSSDAHASHIERLDRYERRSRSRRDKAIKALDEVKSAWSARFQERG